MAMLNNQMVFEKRHSSRVVCRRRLCAPFCFKNWNYFSTLVIVFVPLFWGYWVRTRANFTVTVSVHIKPCAVQLLKQNSSEAQKWHWSSLAIRDLWYSWFQKLLNQACSFPNFATCRTMSPVKMQLVAVWANRTPVTSLLLGQHVDSGWPIFSVSFLLLDGLG